MYYSVYDFNSIIYIMGILLIFLSFISYFIYSKYRYEHNKNIDYLLNVLICVFGLFIIKSISYNDFFTVIINYIINFLFIISLILCVCVIKSTGNKRNKLIFSCMLFTFLIMLFSKLGFILALLLFILYLIYEFDFKKNQNIIFSREAFDVSMKNIAETVVLLNSDNNIMYTNENFISNLIEKNKKYDEIEKLFIDSAIVYLGDEDNQIILNVDDKDYYITYKIQKIINGKMNIGTIIVLKDITNIYENIRELSKRNDEIKEANKILLEYTNAIYVSESQKERVILITEISESIGDNLDELEKKSEDVANSIEVDLDVSKDIEGLTADNKNILADIRKVVKLYKTGGVR